MKLPKPPQVPQLLEQFSSIDIFPYLHQFKATDEKGRYLDWDKFKRVNPKQSEIKWLATKLNRKALQKHFSIDEINFLFCVPESLQALLHFVDKASGGIHSMRFAGLSKNEQDRFLLKSLVMEEAITSAQLEGAVTTRKIAKEMLETARKPRTKDEIMIVNNYQLMKEVIAAQNQPLSVEMILHLHQIATENAIDNNAIPGKYRMDDEIYIADFDGNTIYQPPGYKQLPSLMEAACQFANLKHDGENGKLFLHPIIKAVMLHFLIGYIHPFGDGNGRTARALFYWYMLKSGYSLFEYISISRLLKEAPKQYAMSYINTETDELDLTYFLYYQLNIIKRAMNDLESYIATKQQNFTHFISDIQQFMVNKKVKLNDRQIQILQKAVKEKGYLFTAKEISTEYGVAESTARNDLKILYDLTLLTSFKSGNAMIYVAPNNLLQQLKTYNMEDK
ncbi:Fic family protein [Aggregatibacter actinomycetemcomitans]|uniref:Fic family protein n=1 Tax=Aggregatibacter actinomycetemcomitans TaxID=714 RepID=UPI00197B3CB5|nr:Fic family protein [Aggregatibacter actinomycetemcomitans]MBN6071293.1 Fic family protein [Aggregatibacter actinomycetemcomitans]